MSKWGYHKPAKLTCIGGSLKDCYIDLESIIQLMKDEPNFNKTRQQRRQLIREMEVKAKKQKKRVL